MTRPNTLSALPPRIAALERDSRGYPVPYIVLRDKEGKPQFAINDIRTIWRAIKENRCHICGQELETNPWFVGGPGSALLNGENAVYGDGPMHKECMIFALQTCPYLLQLMSKAVGPVASEKLKEQDIQTFDTSPIPGTPAIFVAVQSWRFSIERIGIMPQFHVLKPFRKIEYWQHGQLQPRKEGEKAARHAAHILASVLKQKAGNLHVYLP